MDGGVAPTEVTLQLSQLALNIIQLTFGSMRTVQLGARLQSTASLHNAPVLQHNKDTLPPVNTIACLQHTARRS